MNVLEGHVDVADHLRIAGDGGDHVVAPVSGMGVEQANPELARDGAERVEQGGQPGSPRLVDRLARTGFLLPEIHAVVGGVLADEVDLLHARGDETLDLPDHRLDGAAAVATAHPGDDAEGAGVIASLGDLHIGGVRGGEADTGRVVVGDVGGSPGDLDKRLFPFLIEQPVKEGTGPLDLVEAHERVDLGKLRGKIGGIALREAAADDEFLAGLRPVETATVRLQDGPDALFLGGIDEAAGIHQNHVGFVGLGGEFVTMTLGISKHDLRIDEVLGAAEADEADLAALLGGSGGG